MKTKNCLIFIVCSALYINTGFAQDFHFSHYDANPLYLNPALTSEQIMKDDENAMQFNINYRDQSGNYNKGVGKNQSIASGLSLALNKRFSIGEYIINNRSVDGAFNTLNFMLSGAYKIIDSENDKDSRHNLSVGLQVGFMQKSFKPQNLVFDAQYSPSAADGFDESLANGENFENQSLLNFDANMGVYYRTTFSDNKISPFIGFSLYHITRPKESFYGEKNYTPMRINIHGGAYIKAGEELTFLPQFLYMNQAKANELNIGTLLFYKIKDTNYEPLIGINWRNKNAVVMQFGLKTKSAIFRMSYDFNIYYLKKYNNRALEFSIIYNVKRKNKSDLNASFL